LLFLQGIVELVRNLRSAIKGESK